jgi:hypothetical protein
MQHFEVDRKHDPGNGTAGFLKESMPGAGSRQPQRIMTSRLVNIGKESSEKNLRHR